MDVSEVSLLVRSCDLVSDPVSNFSDEAIMCLLVVRSHSHHAAALEKLGTKAFVSHQPVISDGQTMGTDGMRSVGLFSWLGFVCMLSGLSVLLPKLAKPRAQRLTICTAIR